MAAFELRWAVTFARRLFEDPVIMTRYRDMMRTMLNEVWDDDILAELASMEALIGHMSLGKMQSLMLRTSMTCVYFFRTET